MLCRSLLINLDRRTSVRSTPPSIFYEALLMRRSGTFLDGTDLTLRLGEETLEVEVMGTILTIADLCEQFAWIGATCRTARPTSPTTFLPTVSIIDFTPETQPSNVLRICFEYHMQDLQESDCVENGKCWQHLFRNPVIVPEFPILARDHNEGGLEIPLDMMSRLGGADRATIFDGQLIIKGFSTMFVPTARIHNSILWHLIRNENDQRISYLDAKKHCSTRNVITTYAALESTRNFLGWSASVLLYTGE